MLWSILLVGLALSVLVFCAMFGYLGDWGSSFPIGTTIAWHAVLMTLGFGGLMPFGRWSYYHGTSPTQEKRKVHFVVMVLAGLATLGGFIGVIWAHWPMKRYFGYDFDDGKFSVPGGQNLRYVHIYLGWLATLGVFAQAFMGRRKLSKLEETGGAERIFTFHGTLGKVLIAAGCVNVIIATSFWGGWNDNVKVIVYILACISLFFGAVHAPKRDDNHNRPSIPLTPMSGET